jgi:hypothetical protein
VTPMQQMTHVTDSPMCIEHIINPMRHQVKLIRRLEVA